MVIVALVVSGAAAAAVWASVGHQVQRAALVLNMTRPSFQPTPGPLSTESSWTQESSAEPPHQEASTELQSTVGVTPSTPSSTTSTVQSTTASLSTAQTTNPTSTSPTTTAAPSSTTTVTSPTTSEASTTQSRVALTTPAVTPAAFVPSASAPAALAQFSRNNLVCRQHKLGVLCVSVRDEICLLKRHPVAEDDMMRATGGYERILVARMKTAEVDSVYKAAPDTFTKCRRFRWYLA